MAPLPMRGKLSDLWILGKPILFILFTVNGNLPSNTTNSEYRDIISNPNSRNPALVTNQLQNLLGLSPVQDFEKTFARKLDSSQYIYNSKVGFLSLSQPLQADEVSCCGLPIFLQWKNFPGRRVFTGSAARFCFRKSKSSFP